MKKIFLIIVFFLLSQKSVLAAAACETRAVWVNTYAFTTAELDKAQSAHLNTLFVIAPPITNNNGINYGEGTPAQFLSFVQQAKSRGFSVHAWIIGKMRTGSSQVDFTSASEQQAQADWVVSLMDTYGAYLDGVHYDYIRYSYSAINASQLAGVSATVQKAHSALKAKYPNAVLSAAVFTTEPNNANFTTEAIPQWYRDWFTANPGNWYQNTYGDGTNNVPEFFKEQQDPVGWVRNHNIEAVASMMYGMNDTLWNREADAWKSFLTYQSSNLPAGIMGLGWLTQSGQPDWGFDAPGIVRKIKYGRSVGITGFSIFELGTSGVNDTPLISALSVDSSSNNNDAPYKSAVSSCLSSSVSLPGDLTGDGRVDLFDLRQFLSNFTSIFDYNLVVRNFGKTQ